MSDAAASIEIAGVVVNSDGEPSTATEPLSLPADADSWRSLIARVPQRDLLRILVKDKTVQGKVFAGFRPGADTLRRSLVIQRVVELVQKDGKWAKQIAEIAPALIEPAEASLYDPAIVEAPEPPRLAETKPLDDDPRLRAKVKQQRADLREKDATIALLEKRLGAAESERDAAQTLLVEAEVARRLSEAEAERERHHRQRVLRRDERAQSSQPVAKAPIAVTLTTSAATPTSDGLLIEGLRRLMSRGKYGVVVELCRETIAADENGAPATMATRGHVRAAYAAALYGLGQMSAAAAQDQLAAGLLIDGGELLPAAASLGRVLSIAPEVRPGTLAPTLRRLLILADKHNEIDVITDTFTHVRIASADASKRLNEALASITGSGLAKIIARLKPGNAGLRIAPDEAVALPTTSQRTAAVSPRRIVSAADSGDAKFIAECRAGLRVLQIQGGEGSLIAKALLEATAALDPLAVAVLAQPANHPVVVDASNVARYNPDPLSLSRVTRVDNLLTLRSYLIRRGFFPILLVADANLRFKVDRKPAYIELVARGLVRESPPGTSADEEFLSLAQTLSAPLVTNDRLADWGDRASGIERLGFVFERDGVSLTEF